MSEKSDLEYLLEALDASRDGVYDELRFYVSRAIERRKQDLAVDNTPKGDKAEYTEPDVGEPDCPHGYWKAHCGICRQPKGGGDVRRLYARPNELHSHSPDCRATVCTEVVAASDYDALESRLREARSIIQWAFAGGELAKAQNGTEWWDRADAFLASKEQP